MSAFSEALKTTLIEKGIKPTPLGFSRYLGKKVAATAMVTLAIANMAKLVNRKPNIKLDEIARTDTIDTKSFMKKHSPGTRVLNTSNDIDMSNGLKEYVKLKLKTSDSDNIRPYISSANTVLMPKRLNKQMAGVTSGMLSSRKSKLKELIRFDANRYADGIKSSPVDVVDKDLLDAYSSIAGVNTISKGFNIGVQLGS